MTFLELCQAVARESGTVPTIGDPETTQGQTGRLLRIVKWTSDAYTMLQNERQDWTWLEAEFTGTLNTGVREHDAGALGISNRFGWWINSDQAMSVAEGNFFSLYETAKGISDERMLNSVDYLDFRTMYQVGSATEDTGRPVYISIGTDQHLYVYPTPDTTYTLRGRYMRGAQTLSDDDDVPEMPAQFHMIIVYRALKMMAQFDEAVEQWPMWDREEAKLMAALVARHTPKVSTDGAFG